MDPHAKVSPVPLSPADRLDSWKVIASYLAKDIRTVQRYEGEGLPVYRRQHEKHGSVYAYKSELDRWWTSREPASHQERAEFSHTFRRLDMRRYLRPAIYITIGIAITSSVFLARQLIFGGNQALASSSNVHSTVAVLRFSDASPALSNSTLVQDFTQTVVANLRLRHSLRVLDASEMDSSSGGPADQAYIANTLHADQVLSGTVSQERNAMRITAQLTDARSGKLLWQTQFQDDTADTKAFESGVAHAVALEVENALLVEGK